MKVVRHGKPKGEYLKTLRSPRSDDWALLVRACIEAIIGGSEDVLVAFSYVFKFPDDFPRGIREEKVDDKNVHRIKAKKLLKWLHENGHTEVTMEVLKGHAVSFGIKTTQFDKFLDSTVELSDNNEIGESIEDNSA